MLHRRAHHLAAHRHAPAWGVGAAVVCATLMGAPALAVQGDDSPMAPKPRELQGIEIEDKLGTKVPLDVELTDESGKAVKLGQYFDEKAGGKPVLLVLGYYECPMLCSLVLNGTLEALKPLSLDVGDDFSVVTVSINPKETVELAKSKRANYLRQYGRDGADAGWHFHVATEAESRRLADAVGFKYRWDERAQQYAHAAGIFFLSPDGTLTRTLYGMAFQPNDVKFALMEASQGTVGTITDRLLLSCFSYTPDKQQYGVYVWGVMRLGGVLTMLLLGGILFILWRRERQHA